jgi:hypothetical protein
MREYISVMSAVDLLLPREASSRNVGKNMKDHTVECSHRQEDLKFYFSVAFPHVDTFDL